MTISAYIRFWFLALLVAGTVAAPATALAQGRGTAPVATSTPQGASTPIVAGGRLDLAAMALDSLDIPPELLLSFETYFDFEQVMMLMVGESIDRSAMEGTGLRWFYQSSYTTPSASISIRSYVEEYSDDAGAMAGFELLENEATFVPDAAFTDEPLAIGDGPAELTIGSYGEVVPDSGPTSIDLTFRVGRVVAGVGIDMADGLTVDRDLALQLASRLEERVRAVLAGEPIPAIDTSLPQRYVHLGSGWYTTNEGYWILRDLYGPDVSADIQNGFDSGYFWAGGYDPQNAGGFPLPRVAIETASFVDERSALLFLSSIPALRPNMQTFETLDVAAVPGASVTLGYQFPNQFFENAALDSVRLVMLTGSIVLTVDVQGNGDIPGALAAATAIAEAQVACLSAVAPCDSPAFPPALWIVPGVEPVASPVG